jgi:hypothetical protein
MPAKNYLPKEQKEKLQIALKEKRMQISCCAVK